MVFDEVDEDFEDGFFDDWDDDVTPFEEDEDDGILGGVGIAMYIVLILLLCL